MNNFSQQQLNRILALIREVEKLSDIEKLYLYLHLPCGKSGLIDAGKTKSNNRLRLQNTLSKNQLTSSSTSRPSSPLSFSLPSPATLSDFQKQLEQMPKRPDQETTQTYTWILSHLEVDPNVSLPKQEVYEEYKNFCQMNQFEPLCVADFGKAMKYAFPCIKPRRLGQRGNSRYCYSGLRKKYKLESPNLPSMDFSGNIDQQQHHVNQHNSNLVNMDTTTTRSPMSAIVGSATINDEQLTPLNNINTTNNNDIMTNNSNLTSSCIKKANLSACNIQVPLAPSDRVRVQAGCAQQKRSDTVSTSTISTGIVPNINNAYTNPATTLITAPAISIAPSSTTTTSTPTTHYNENNQYDNQQSVLYQNSNPHSINQRDSLMTPIDFENIYNSSNNNSMNSTPDFNTNPQVSQQNNVTSMSVQQQQQVPSSSSYSRPLSQSSYQPRNPVVSQALFDQGTSMVGATSYNIPRPGTPDDDEYSHNYNNYVFNNYQQQQDNCMNNNTAFPQQRHDYCNNININYASNFRCQQNFIHQSQQSQQHHQHGNNNNNNNIDDNNNQQQYHQQQHQQQHQQHQHHVTTPTGSSVNADPALSNGGAGPGYNSNDSRNMGNGNDTNFLNASNKFTNAHNNSYNNFVPKREPNESIPFKQNDHQQIQEQQKQDQQQVVINQATPLSMFTLDSCVSSPFQSPASTPYPSHMIVATTPTYEPTTNGLNNFTSQQDSILSSGSSTQNHYMTT